jgi:hypothetical protein
MVRQCNQSLTTSWWLVDRDGDWFRYWLSPKKVIQHFSRLSPEIFQTKVKYLRPLLGGLRCWRLFRMGY